MLHLLLLIGYLYNVKSQTPPIPPPPPPPLRYSLSGFDCNPPHSTDPPLSTMPCYDPNQALVVSGSGKKVECFENFSCCLCKQIICNACDGVIVNGDSGAIGVADMQIAGIEETGGSNVDCNGDLSCQECSISGVGISELKFTGDGAAQGAQVIVSCILALGGCPVLCVGDNSCAGPPWAPFQSLFKITNSRGLYCADEACYNGVFECINNQGGELQCGNEQSCELSTITISNIALMACGWQGCMNAGIFITDPQTDFYVECKGVRGCKNLMLTITITVNGPKKIGGFICSGLSSCDGMTVRIIAPPPTPGSGGALIIKSIDCTGGCDEALFDLTNARVIKCINCPFDLFDPFWVPPLNAGILKAQISKLECKPPNSCFQKTYTIINPNDGFELNCDTVAICQSATINLNYLSSSTASSFKGPKCGSRMSCKDLKINIINDSGITIKIEKLECPKVKGCEGLTLTTTQGIGSGGAYVEQVICGPDPTSCFLCTINGIACDVYVPPV